MALTAEVGATACTIIFAAALIWTIVRRGVSHPLVRAWERRQPRFAALALAGAGVGMAFAGGGFGDAAGVAVLFAIAAAAVPSLAVAFRLESRGRLEAAGCAIALCALPAALL